LYGNDPTPQQKALGPITDSVDQKTILPYKYARIAFGIRFTVSPLLPDSIRTEG
jgi:hypothetical protein